MHINDVRKELKRSQYDLLSKEGVISIGIGYKTSNGIKTNELSLVCSVEHKKPEWALRGPDLIPKKIRGITTDVIQSGVIRAISSPAKRLSVLDEDSGEHITITAGTLGCTVLKNGKLMILSNNPVIANSNDIMQPGAYNNAILHEWVPLNFIEKGLSPTKCPIARGSAFLINIIAFLSGSKSRVQAYSLQALTNLVDAALAEPINEDIISRVVEGIGEIRGIKEVTIGMEVHKQDHISGYTKGIVDQVDMVTRVNYGTNKTAIFSDQISITSYASEPFSQDGDTGSAVLSENDIVGLLFARSDTATIVNRIQNVFDAFDCTLLGVF
jgi:hypothetical protein